MDAKEYVGECRKHLNKRALVPIDGAIAMCALGIVGESGELVLAATGSVEAATRKEYGDLCYYCAMMCDLVGLEFSVVAVQGVRSREFGLFMDMHLKSSALAEYIKKALFHDKAADIDLIADLVCQILNIGATLSQVSFAEREQIYAENIAKLQARHGGDCWNPTYQESP